MSQSHDERTVRRPSEVADQPRPALFVLRTVYKGEPQIVADGVAFPPPNERVVINWRASTSIELVDGVTELYQKFGDTPNILWHHGDGKLAESEPAQFVH